MSSVETPSQFSYSIGTMGCKANIYDSLVMEKMLEEIGGKKIDSEEKPDLFILNSCTVTEEADKQAHKTILNIQKENTHTKTILTGCLAEILHSKKEDSTADVLLPNTERHSLKKVVAETLNKKEILSHTTTTEDESIFWGQLPTTSLGRTRAFLKIQEGCNDYCTYCIIPYARGASRSVRPGAILAEIERLSQNGVQEIILTGTNIADYGLEFSMTFDDLVTEILTKTTLKRLRLSSLDPSEVSDRLLEMMKSNSRLMPHFHISLQSANSRVLRAMKRKYDHTAVEDCLWRIYKTNPDIFVGMDVIAGFPSETLEEHQSTYDLLKATPWTRLHVFPYSSREGTPATRIKGLAPHSERKRRAKELMQLSSERHESFVKKYLNSTMNDVLFESVHTAGLNHFVSGYTPNYCRVLVQTNTKELGKSLHNTIQSVKVLNLSPKPAQDWTLESEVEFKS